LINLRTIISPTKNNQVDDLNAVQSLNKQQPFSSITSKIALKLKNLIQKDFSSSNK